MKDRMISVKVPGFQENTVQLSPAPISKASTPIFMDQSVNTA